MGTTWSKDDDDESLSSFSSSEEDAPAEETTTGRERQIQQLPPPPPPPPAADSGYLSLAAQRQPARSSPQRIRKPPIKLQQYVVAGQTTIATVPQQEGSKKEKAGSSSTTKKRSGPVAKDDVTRHPPAVAAGGHKKRALNAVAKGPAKKARRAAPTAAVQVVGQEADKIEVGKLSRRAASWLKKYQELVAFHSHHGHCRVPQDTKKQHSNLSNWCWRQKKNKQEQKLSAEEIHKLDNLGFEWTVTVTNPHPTFEDKCQELEAFKKKFHHCNVPCVGEFNTLYQWLYKVKRRYNGNYQRYKKLTQDQIDRLESIGIDWSIQDKGKGRAAARKRSKEDSTDDDDDESFVE